MSEDSRFGVIVALALVMIVALIAGAALRGCTADRDAFTNCVRAGREPLECRAALRQ